MQSTMEIVEELKHLFWSCLTQMLPNHPIENLIHAGNTVEGSHAVRPNEFDILILLDVDPSVWEFIDAGPTLLAAHGFHLVKRTNLDYFSPGASVYDKYLVSDYLSPSKLRTVFLDIVNRINWGDKYKVQPAVMGPDVKLNAFPQVDYPGVQHWITINFIPAVQIGSTIVTAKTHPHSSQYQSYDNLWQRYFMKEEIEKLQMPEHGCQLMCLKILKAIQQNHMAHLGMLSTEALKAVVFLTMEQEDDWLEESLGERFIDVLKALEDYTRSGNLPHPFNPKVNLLDGISQEELSKATNFVANVIGEGKFSWLLK